MTEKKRIDLLLVERGLYTSREKARAAIMAGEVKVEDAVVDKPGQQIDAGCSDISVKSRMPYVSRGGLKLERALAVFNIDLQGRVVLDIGASTGGFTDCALQKGARKVYAVDVGYGQIAWSLRNDPRVHVLERTNIRYLEKNVFKSGLPDFITIDVSFISLALVLPRLEYLLDNFEGVALVKPQFEAGRDRVGKKGVVRDPLVHKEVLLKVFNRVTEMEAAVSNINYSPVKGPEGNIEYLLHFQKPGLSGPEDIPALIRETVETAHRELD